MITDPQKPCGGTRCIEVWQDQFRCNEDSPCGQYYCTLPKHHTSNHSACADDGLTHDIVVWDNLN